MPPVRSRRNHARDIDQDLLQLTLSFSPRQRFQRLLTTHQFMVAIRRSALQKQYPTLSERELMLKVIESFADE